MAIWEEVRGRRALDSQRDGSLLVTLAEGGICLLLGAILANARVFGHCVPFGIAAVAAAGPGLAGLMTLLGSLLGYIVFQSAFGGLHYGAAAVLTFALMVALQEVKFTKKDWFAPAVAACFCALCGFIYLSGLGFTGGDVIFYVTEIALVAGAALLYRGGFQAGVGKGGQIEWENGTVRVGVLALGASCLIALSGVLILGEFSLGRIAAAMAVMLLSRQGVQAGLMSGAVTGLIMDAASGRGPYYAMAYTLSGLLSGLCGAKRRIATALCYVAANSAVVFWTWQSGMRTTLLYEVFLASVLFMLLPQKAQQLGASVFSVPEGEAGESGRARQAVAGQLQRTALAFRALYESVTETFQAPPESAEDPTQIFRRAADRQCRKCAGREGCWQSGFQDTQHALNDASRSILARGRAEEADFPAHFRSRCRQFPAFVQAVDAELTDFLHRRQYRSRLRENRNTVCRQYAQLDQILDKAAAELGAELTPDLPREAKLNGFLRSRGLPAAGAAYYDGRGRLRVETPRHENLSGEAGREQLSSLLDIALREGEPISGERLCFQQAEPFRAVAGVYGRSKEGERVSGDTGTWFRREDGLLCILLCDGMGSGEDARRESGLAVRLLQGFLKAGVEPETALQTVNSALSLRGEETGGCTTVDLLTIELFTGVCSIYKFGAAPSYLRKGSHVSRVKGAALPAGVFSGEEIRPEMTRFRGREGDWIVLLSDGLIGGEGDEWLQDHLRQNQEQSPGKLAQALLTESLAHSQASDDSTVIAVRLEKRA